MEKKKKFNKNSCARAGVHYLMINPARYLALARIFAIHNVDV